MLPTPSTGGLGVDSSIEGILGYAAPLLARIRVNRDALATGRVPLTHQTLFRSPAANVSDRLSVNEGAQPSDFGREFSIALTAAEQAATAWACGRLQGCGMDAEESARTIELHVAWHLAASISFDETQAINRARLAPPVG